MSRPAFPSSIPEEVLDLALDLSIEKKRYEEEAEMLSESFAAFIPAAWPALKPEDEYLHNWHIDAMAEHLDAVSRGEITRLQVWVPPVSMAHLKATVAA